MVRPIVYKNVISNDAQTVYAPAELKTCHLKKGLKNESQLKIIDSTINGLCTSICGLSKSEQKWTAIIPKVEFTAVHSQLDKMEADHDITLETTSAKTIHLKKGKLTIKNCKQAYEVLDAPAIVASDIASKKIHSKALDANNCTFNSVKSGINTKVTDSVIKKSFIVSVKKSSTITIDLQNTVIDKDLIIKAPFKKTKKLAEDAIEAPMKLTNFSNGLFACRNLILSPGARLEHKYSDFTLSLPKKYNSLSEVPDHYKSRFAAIVGEGETGHLGDFECIVNSGVVELYVPQPKKINIDPSLDTKSLTLSILKQRLEGLGNSNTIGDIEFLGGRFRKIGEKLCMVKAPPNLSLIANPSVKVEVIGGLIKGEIRLKNCHGTIEHIVRSTVPNPNAQEPGKFPLFQKPQQENIILAQPEKKEGLVPFVVPAAEPLSEQKNEPAEEQPAEYVVRVFPADPDDDDFMCPITLERMTNPYRIPTEFQTHAVDYDSLVLLCQGKGEFTCPFTDKKFKLADCKPDIEMKAHLEKLLPKE